MVIVDNFQGGGRGGESVHKKDREREDNGRVSVYQKKDERDGLRDRGRKRVRKREKRVGERQ